MNVAAPDPAGAFVFHPPPSGRRRHHHHHHGHRNHYYDNRHYPSDSDTDSTFSTRSSYSSSDSEYDDDSSSAHCHHRVSFRPRHRARRRRWWEGWPRGGSVLAYPDSYYASSPWATTALGAGVVGAAGLVPTAPAGFVTTSAAGTVVPQIQLQQAQAQTQQQQPRRYGYRRFHYQGGERVRSRGCGHGHGHGHHNHHHHRQNGRAQSPRRCILPRFGRWLIGDPPDRVRRGRRCEDGCGGGCCDDGCGVGATTPTVHHEDEYWGPGHSSAIPNWATGSQNSPWRYGGPNGNQNNGPGDTVGPGGTIDEVEEGGTAPAAATAAATVQPTAVLPVHVAAPTTALDPYDHQPKHTHHYHLNNNDEVRRRDGKHTHRHCRDRHHHRRGGDEDGILGLVERERRRDSERQMADADASHRREAMMMELMERARRGERDRDRDRDGAGGLDARDILGVLLEGVAERRGTRREGRGSVAGEERGGGECNDGDDGLKGALDALSRRVDEMVLSDREKGTAAERAAAPARRKMKHNMAPRVKFNKVDSDSASAADRNGGGGLAGGKKGGAVGGKITFSRRGRDVDRAGTDSDETSGPPLADGGKSMRRGRALRRAGSTSTSSD